MVDKCWWWSCKIPATTHKGPRSAVHPPSEWSTRNLPPAESGDPHDGRHQLDDDTRWISAGSRCFTWLYLLEMAVFDPNMLREQQKQGNYGIRNFRVNIHKENGTFSQWLWCRTSTRRELFQMLNPRLSFNPDCTHDLPGFQVRLCAVSAGNKI